ncbi:PqqD family protein [Pararhodonellum marinum]|uniref:PqqD family protein n=1 Tax=Pararhodonellum marinum TaxID=2755358 RepID=UPI00189007F1|nr:PqqD family protein [Pararhodonellum marinum]
MIKYQRKEDVISGKLQEELVMMDLEKGKYFSLNPVATRIWELLENPLNKQELCSILMEEYDIASEVCEKDTLSYLEEMTKLGLIKRV